MKAHYVRAMDVLHRFCMIVAGFCLVVITLMIPWGVFTRYVLNSASSWPEPMAVLLMIWFSFLSACVCYRENLHIGVAVIPMMLEGKAQHRDRLADRAVHDGHQPVHVLVGHQAVSDHLVSGDLRFPLVFGRRVLSAGPDRRPDHGAVRHRAAVDLEPVRAARPTTPSRQISTE